jgi:hypothetical protein
VPRPPSSRRIARYRRATHALAAAVSGLMWQLWGRIHERTGTADHDYVATDEGGFLNLVTGELLGVTEMLSRYSRAELDGGTISKIHIEIQWDLAQRWDSISY